MKIYIGCFRKKSDIHEKGYYSIQLGAANSKEKICEITDDSGENISEKNPLYCELSGLYWMWKNTTDKIIGLVHYRRFFYEKTIVFNKNKVATAKKVEQLLKKYDLILPSEGLLFSKTVFEQYKNSHDENDLKVCGDVIKEVCPEYLDVYHKVLKSNHYHPLNMFIGKKEIIDGYCKWLFPILQELESRIDIDKKDNYNKRFCGFIAERLFNVYVIKNSIKYTTLPVYNVEQSMLKQISIQIIKNIINIKR